MRKGPKFGPKIRYMYWQHSGNPVYIYFVEISKVCYKMCFNLLYTAFKIYHLKNSMECDCNFLGVFSATAMYSQLLQFKIFTEITILLFIQMFLQMAWLRTSYNPIFFHIFNLRPNHHSSICTYGSCTKYFYFIFFEKKSLRNLLVLFFINLKILKACVFFLPMFRLRPSSIPKVVGHRKVLNSCCSF